MQFTNIPTVSEYCAVKMSTQGTYIIQQRRVTLVYVSDVDRPPLLFPYSPVIQAEKMSSCRVPGSPPTPPLSARKQFPYFDISSRQAAEV